MSERERADAESITCAETPGRERMVWMNGALCRASEARLSLEDRGARDGEGLFETLAVHRGQPVMWLEHMERMVLAAAELGFPVPPAPARLLAGLDQLLQAERLSDAVARVTVTRGLAVARRRGPRTFAPAWIEVEPIESRRWRGARTGAARAIRSSRPFEPGPLGAYKTTSRLAYQLARDEARAAGADEALLVSPAGEWLEGAVSNLFVAIGGEVLTPPLARGILPGIARAVVLDQCARLGIPAREAMLEDRDIARADEVFLTNSIQEVVPLATLEGSALPGRAIGERLARAYRAAVSAGTRSGGLA
jgi:branched-subunit amino acid aminotransferase/4-amino-4-deoxychorismate lyase